MSAVEQAMQENRSITKRESSLRLYAGVILAGLLLILLGFHSVSSKAALVVGCGDARLEASGAFLACPGVLCTSMLRVCGLNEAPGRLTKHLEEQTWNAS